MNVTDTASRVRHSTATRRHEVVRGHAIAIRIRTIAIESRTRRWTRDADTHVTDTAARVRHRIATRRRKVMRGHDAAIRLRITAIKSCT